MNEDILYEAPPEANIAINSVKAFTSLESNYEIMVLSSNPLDLFSMINWLFFFLFFIGTIPASHSAI